MTTNRVIAAVFFIVAGVISVGLAMIGAGVYSLGPILVATAYVLAWNGEGFI